MSPYVTQQPDCGNGVDEGTGRTENWDETLVVDSPGQSDNPDDPHYRDLFDLRNRGEYFPVYLSKDKIKAVADKTLLLTP